MFAREAAIHSTGKKARRLIGSFAASSLALLLAGCAVHEAPPPAALEGPAALAAYLEGRAAGLANPIPESDESALLAGIRIYRANCAGCHGGLRGMSEWGSTGFIPPAPQFWQEPVAVTPPQAFVAIRDGIPNSGMASWRSLLSEAEMWQAANFVSRMHALPPSIDAAWRTPPTAAPQG